MANRLVKLKALHCIFLFFILMPMASRLEAKVTKSEFGSTPDGTKVEIYTLEEGALKARIMTYGARLVSLEVPDRSGKPGDIVLGYESLAGLHCRPQELLWVHRRALRQPDRPRQFYPRRQASIICLRMTGPTRSMAASRASTSSFGTAMRFLMGSSSPW